MIEEKNEKLVNFYLDVELKKELDIISKRDGKSLKEIYTELSTEFVRDHKDGNDQHTLDSFSENEDFVGFPSVAISYQNKKDYIERNCQVDGRLTDFGKTLLGHVIQYYTELMKL